jgi:adenylyltransferase/sulfurtransferase
VDYEQFCGIPQAHATEAQEALVPGVSAPELKAKIDRGDRFVLLDVREPFEYDICRIPGARLIPLAQLPSRMSELDSADEIVLQCKSGVRSARALKLLNEAGFDKLFNLEGGILAWAEQVDPSVPKY